MTKTATTKKTDHASSAGAGGSAGTPTTNNEYSFGGGVVVNNNDSCTSISTSKNSTTLGGANVTSTAPSVVAPRTEDFRFVDHDGDSSHFFAATSTIATTPSISGIETASAALPSSRSGNNTNASPSQALQAPSQKQRRSSEALEGLTINKLRFNKLGLYGREDEIRQLQERLQHFAAQRKIRKTTSTNDMEIEQAIITSSNTTTSNADDISNRSTATIDKQQDMRNDPQTVPALVAGAAVNNRELVTISGYSGTGKSALASTLKRPVALLHGLYVSGKFDLYNRDEPLTAMADACGQICGKMLALANSNADSETRRFEEIRDKIVDELGSELRVITRVIPALEEVVMQGRDFRMMEQPGGSGMAAAESTEESKNQLNYAFRRFIRVVSSCFAPLIMVLDDLQWADMTSLELIGKHMLPRSPP